MSTRFLPLIGLLLLFAAAPATADSLELKDGTRLNGKFVGGTAEVVRFVVGDKLRVLSVGEIKKLVFGELRTGAQAKGASETPSTPVSEQPSEPAEDSKPSEAAPLV